jgi:hypothetical protein
MSHQLPICSRRLIMSAKLLSFYRPDHNIEFQLNKTAEYDHKSTLINEHYEDQDENDFYVLGYN